jgi:hypothetical protein
MKKTSKRVSRNTSNIGRLIPMGDAGDVIVKRMTFPAGGIQSNAAAVIPVTSFTTSGVESDPASEWASFSARYQQYRVRAVRLIGKAKLPVNTATALHGTFYVADFIGTATPSTAAQVLSDERCKVLATYKDFVYEVDWSRNPNARLWNPTSAAIPSANQYGIVWASNPNDTLAVSISYFSTSFEWLVEFRGSQ